MAYKCWAQTDTLSLNDAVNKEFQDYSRSRKPWIDFNFYFNGKKVIGEFKIYIVSNNKPIKSAIKTKTKLTAIEFEQNDSISFVLEYKTYRITTNQIKTAWFKYGGCVTFGLISDIHEQEINFKSDSISYFQNNLDSYLSDFIPTSIRSYNKTNKMKYSVVKLSTTDAVRFRHEFF